MEETTRGTRGAKKRSSLLGILCLLWFLPLSVSLFSQTLPNNYADDKSWLCRPGRHDACDVDMTATVVNADGKLSKETWKADPNAPIDCFYVYPTVSTDATPNSDMIADPAELNVVRQQFARFASKCKPYAPLYRQVSVDIGSVHILASRDKFP